MTMKQRIEQFLEEHRIPYDVVAHERTATSLQAAHAAHVETGRLAKAVLLEGDDCFMAAMIPADHDVRLGQLQLDYGEHLHLADEATIREMFTDCDPGAVPGLPTAWGIETVWDDDLLAQPDIYLESGDHRRLIHLETRYLQDNLPEMPHCRFSGPRKLH
jgi:Ala-tRNA(Pro) deacylase